MVSWGMQIRRALSVLSLVATPLFVASSADAHVRMTAPGPRDNMDNHKAGPCGAGSVKAAIKSTFTSGQNISVELEETIDHRGCFVVDLATADNQTFQVLKIAQGGGAAANFLADPANAVPLKRTVTATLPAGLTCNNCTLRVRQLMHTTEVGCNENTVPASGTYFSCADVRINAAVVPDAGADSAVPAADSGIPASDGGTTSSGDAGMSTSDGSTVNPGGGGNGGVDEFEDESPFAKNDSGCAMQPESGGSTLTLGALALAAVIATRRSRKNSRR